MKKFIYTSLLIVSVFSSNCFAQKVEKADKEYDKYAYIDAIKTYERIAQKGYKSIDRAGAAASFRSTRC